MEGVRGLPKRFGWQLLAVLLAGVAVRALLIALTPGEYWDLNAIRLAGAAFDHSPLHLYAFLNVAPYSGHYQGLATYAWPYPPAFLPITGLMHWVSVHVGPSVNRQDRALVGAGDIALAWLVQWALGRAGRSERERLTAAALIALGPTFVAVSAVHGQLDSLGWLPAVGAFILWARRSRGWHVLACGALIGLGIDIKTVPGLVLLALAPTARSRRELVVLVGAAAAVVAVSLVPFAATSTRGLSAIVHYSGFPGRGGLTALLQPRLTLHALGLGTPEVPFDPLTRFLLFHSSPILLAALIAVAVAGHRRRLPPSDVMVALILAVYVFAPAVLPQYWLWVVPFLVLGGRLRAALIYQLAMLPLLVATYAFLQEPDQPLRHLSNGLILDGYVPVLWVVTLGLLAGLVALLAGQAQLVSSNWRAQELMQ